MDGTLGRAQLRSLIRNKVKEIREEIVPEKKIASMFRSLVIGEVG